MAQPIETLEPGLYECSIPSDYKSVNAPADPNGAGYIAEINVTNGQSGRKHIILIQNYQNYIWSKTIHTDGNDRGWIVLNPQSQKYRLTNDDGTNFFEGYTTINLNNEDEIKKIPSGIRYISRTTGLPTDVSSTNGWLFKLVRSDSQLSTIYFQPYNSSQLLQRVTYNGLSEWRYINQASTDTGWVTLPLVNGATPDVYSDTYLPVSYRVRKTGDNKTVQIIGNIKKLSTGLVFAQLPSNITPVRNIEYKLNQRIGTSSALAYLASDGTMKVVGTVEADSTYMINLTYMV